MINVSSIAVVIPCYKVERHIEKVVSDIPQFVDHIILVNDCSPDNTLSILNKIASVDTRVIVISNVKNMGVGGAMLTGFKSALQIGCDVVVKIDGDGQMDCSYIESMVSKISDNVDYVKGNRFFDRKMLTAMPWVRRMGNTGIGFLVKMASGYWEISDPTNGFFCIKTSTIQKIETQRIANRFFFESSLLIELYYTGAVIKEISMPAIYADEKSNLSVFKTLLTFPPKLLHAFNRRILLRYFVFDFNICSLYILFGVPMFLFGVIFGVIKWIQFASVNTPAPTGTIMIPVLAVVLGFQLLLAAVQFDITSKNPFNKN